MSAGSVRAVRLAGAVDDDGHEKVGGIVLEQRELGTPNPNVRAQPNPPDEAYDSCDHELL
jgi:hypothetical protein